MPLLKFRTLAAGASGIREAGSVHKVESEEAGPLIDGGYAFECDAKGEPIGKPRPIAQTTLPPRIKTASMNPDGSRK